MPWEKLAVDARRGARRKCFAMFIRHSNDSATVPAVVRGWKRVVHDWIEYEIGLCCICETKIWKTIQRRKSFSRKKKCSRLGWIHRELKTCKEEKETMWMRAEGNSGSRRFFFRFCELAKKNVSLQVWRWEKYCEVGVRVSDEIVGHLVWLKLISNLTSLKRFSSCESFLLWMLEFFTKNFAAR